MNSIKFSIIVPVFNTEKYIPKCIESLLHQTYYNIEIICINDGSTDNSLSILKSYQDKDKRIKIISQQNSGVSVARNVGIKEAIGDYILFVDPDDWLELDTCKNLFDQICNNEVYELDVICFGYKRVDVKDIFYHNFSEFLLINKNKISFYSDNYIESLLSFMPAKCIWDKAYKKTFLDKNNIKFIQGMTHGEDLIFFLNVFIYNPYISLLDKELYNYNISRKDSATKINSLEYLKKNIQMGEYINRFENISEKTQIIKNYFFDNVFFALFFLGADLGKNKEFIFLLKKYLDEVSDVKLKKLRGYKSAKLQLFLSQHHLSDIYWFMRPLVKEYIVIPIRKLRQRRENV